MKKLCVYCVTAVLITFLVTVVYGCQCEPLPVCASFTNARRVFAGDVIDVKNRKTASMRVLDVTFSSQETYKGNAVPDSVVTFFESSCSPKFVKGERYLVFDEGKPIHGFCNATRKLDPRSSDMLQIAGLSARDPRVSLVGSISGPGELRPGSAQLFGEPCSGGLAFPIARSGWFQTDYPAFGRYTACVTFSLLAEADVFVESYTNNPGNSTIRCDGLNCTVTIDSEFVENGCDLRRIVVAPKR